MVQYYRGNVVYTNPSANLTPIKLFLGIEMYTNNQWRGTNEMMDISCVFGPAELVGKIITSNMQKKRILKLIPLELSWITYKPIACVQYTVVIPTYLGSISRNGSSVSCDISYASSSLPSIPPQNTPCKITYLNVTAKNAIKCKNKSGRDSPCN